MLIDSHCHLDRLDMDAHGGELASVIRHARERGIEKLLCVGTDLSRWPTMLEMVEPFEEVQVSLGVHPLSSELDSFDPQQLLALVSDSPKLVALGETGLDYHYASDTAEQQQRCFSQHLELAQQLNKPVIVHTRAAQQDTLDILRQGLPQAGGVLHCFTEDWAMAEQALDLGMYISFSGIITFRNADALREVVKRVPLERILVETDAPYLTPVPYRGKPNQPAYVVEVAECVARLKGLDLDEVGATTSANYIRLFGG